MTVEELIKRLEGMPRNKVVYMTMVDPRYGLFEHTIDRVKDDGDSVTLEWVY